MKPEPMKSKKSGDRAFPKFCSCCGNQFPEMVKNQQNRYKFCGNCGTPVLLGGNMWSNVVVDENGVIHDEPEERKKESNLSKHRVVEFLAKTPTGQAVAGVALAAIGSGMVLAAVPIATCGAALMAAGVTIIKTVTIAGVVMGLVVALTEKDGKAFPGVVQLTVMGVAAGAAIAVTGGVIACIAAITGVLGGVLVATGAVVLCAVAGKQIYLYDKKHGYSSKVKTAIKNKIHGDKNGMQGINQNANFSGLGQIELDENMIKMLLNQKN